MSAYLLDEDGKDLCLSTTRSRLILALVSTWRRQAAQERQDQRRIEQDEELTAMRARGEDIGFGYGSDHDPLQGRDCILPRAFELADAALSDKLEMLAQEYEAYGVSMHSALEHYSWARLFIKERALDKKIVFVS